MEEKRYFIYAYDQMYGGLHGMYEWCFMEGTYEEAEDYGDEMSRNVIESYYEIRYNLFEFEEEDEVYENYSEEEIEEIIENDIAYEIYEVREDAPSFEEMENMNLDPRSYIEEYCITNEF